MKRVLILSILFLSFSSSYAISLNFANKNPTRVMPNSPNQILSYNQVLKDAVKSVVNISTTRNIRVTKNFQMSTFPFPYEFMEPLFRHTPHSRALKSLGSGVIITSDGYIVTNSHVVNGADEIKVTLPHQKKEYKAKIIGIDSESDIAVIKINAKNLNAIKISNSKNVKIGDVVFAIGNPFGVGETVTSGIVSAINKDKVGLNQYENFIQTDASINPGNSGGALVDSRGALIGINSAIISKSGGNNGIGLAIPSNMVVDITKKLIKDGKVIRGYMGIMITDINNRLASIYNHKNGALVVNVEINSPASKAGLKRGDLIYKIDGENIEDASDLKRVIGSKRPGQTIKIELERDKQNIVKIATLVSKYPQDSYLLHNSNLKGLELSNLTNELRYQYRIPSDIEGVLITDILPNSKFEQAGLQAGDVIIQIENMVIRNIKDIKKAMSKYRSIPKRIYVNRYENIFMFVVK